MQVWVLWQLEEWSGLGHPSMASLHPWSSELGVWPRQMGNQRWLFILLVRATGKCLLRLWSKLHGDGASDLNQAWWQLESLPSDGGFWRIWFAQVSRTWL